MTKILLLDLETFPNLVRSWGIYKQHILETIEHTSLACYSAKWLDGKQITRALCDLPGYVPAKYRDDSKLVAELWALLDAADIVIAHYGDGFDLPTLRARFAKYNLPPPSPFKSIDTKKVAAKLFYFGGAYTLDHICSYLGLGKKISTGGYELWQQCMKGDATAWARMKRYNAYDVVLLGKLYNRLRPWMVDHPNVFAGPLSCPKCGSADLQSRGSYRSQTRTYKKFQCQSCRGWSRSTQSESRLLTTNAG